MTDKPQLAKRGEVGRMEKGLGSKKPEGRVASPLGHKHVPKSSDEG